MKNFSFFIIAIGSILLFPVCSFAQNTGWTNYTATGQINSITEDENTVWACGWGGIAMIDKEADEISYFNKSNSGILNNYIWCSIADMQGNRWFWVKEYGLAKYDGQHWERYNTENSGIPCNNIYRMACDPDGNLWMATWEGELVKFDGDNWSVYNSINSGLPETGINSITIDNEGKLWISTQNGLVTFDGENWVTYSSGNSGITHAEISDVAIDEEGNKWIGVMGQGLVKYDGYEWTVYSLTNSELPDHWITEVEVHDNIVWLVGNGTQGGLIRFDGTTWGLYNSANSPLHDFGKGDLMVDTNGDVWLGTYLFGVARFNGNTWKFYNGANSILCNNVNSDIDADRENGNIWIVDYGNHTNYGGGIVKVHNDEWTYYMIDDFVYNVKAENDSTAWVGFDDGIARLQNGIYTVYNSENSGLPDYFVSGIAVDLSGNKWFASNGGGLVKFDGVTWTVYNTGNSPLPGNAITDVAIDQDNSIWIGMLEHGIAHFDGVSWEFYNTGNSGLMSDCVYSIAVDLTGSIWAGHNVGISEFNENTWNSHYPLGSDPETNNLSVYDIAFDMDNNVWVGGGGLAKFNHESWEYFDIYNSGLPHNHVMGLTVDSKNNIWIATDLGGVAVYDQDHSTTVFNNPSDDTFSSVVYPNPAVNAATILLSENLNSATFMLYDQTGRIVKQFNFSGDKLGFSCDGLAPGLYYFNIQTVTGDTTGGKIIIN